MTWASFAGSTCRGGPKGARPRSSRAAASSAGLVRQGESNVPTTLCSTRRARLRGGGSNTSGYSRTGPTLRMASRCRPALPRISDSSFMIWSRASALALASCDPAAERTVNSGEGSTASVAVAR